MIEIVTEKHYSLIYSLFMEAKEEIKIISPFLSKKMANLLCHAASKGVKCSFITRFYLQDFLDGSNSLEGLQNMLDAGVSLYALIGLHTKLYLFDSTDAIVGSANFTEGGLSRNIELSVHFRNELATQSELDAYYTDLVSAIGKAEEGIISQQMLNEYKAAYDKKQQPKNSLKGGIGIANTVRGAALNRKAQEIRKNPFDEIQQFINERNTDAVYGALGGDRERITHKQLKNIILKFSSSAKARHDGTKPMDFVAIEEDGKKFYITNFSTGSEKRAEAVEDLDETYFCVHSYDSHGKPSPMIVGKGFLRQYNSKNDARKKVWFKDYEWLAEYPYYCIVDEARIINAPVNCCIPLREVTNELGFKTYIHSKDDPTKEVTGSHKQQAMLMLTPEARKFIDEKLKELGDEHGWKTYKSEV